MKVEKNEMIKMGKTNKGLYLSYYKKKIELFNLILHRIKNIFMGQLSN